MKTRKTYETAALAVVCGGLVALAMILQALLIPHRFFDEDELEHVHGAWALAHGLVPYRDYFEHHMPGLHLLLSGLIRFFAVDVDPDAGLRFLVAGRAASWLVTGLLLGATFAAGKAWRDGRTGAVAAALLAMTGMFLEKSLEIRPDPWAGLFIVWTLLCLFKGAQPGLADKRRWAAWTLAGAGYGLAMVWTQKVLFVLPGVLAGVLWSSWNRKPGERVKPGRRPWAAALFCFAAGFAGPMIPVLGFFAAQGALDDFFRLNFVTTLGWKTRFSPLIFVMELIRQNPVLVSGGLAGALAAVIRARRLGLKGNKDVLPLVFLASLVAGLWVIPTPYKQYFVLFLPLLALVAGDAVWRLAAWTQRRWPALTAGRLVLVLLLASSVSLFREFRDQARRSNAVQIQLLRFVHETTRPQDTVLDGWTGLGVFRPHAWYYFFLHQEVRPLIPEAAKASLLSGLASGAIAPALVFFDEDLKSLAPSLHTYLKQGYEPVVGDFIWRRRSSPADPRLRTNNPSRGPSGPISR